MKGGGRLSNKKKDYSKLISEKREQLDMLGYKSQKKDTRLIAEVINTLANEDNMTISRAEHILSDATRILPLITQL